MYMLIANKQLQLFLSLLLIAISYFFYCYYQTPGCPEVFGLSFYIKSLEFKYRYRLKDAESVYRHILKLRNSTLDSVDPYSTPPLFFRYDLLIPSYSNSAEEDRDVIAMYLQSDPTLVANKSLSMRVYIPKNASSIDKLPIWIFVHGGGWHLNSVDVYDKFIRFLSARFQVAVLAVNYRKFPYYSYLQTVNDCFYTVYFGSQKLATHPLFSKYNLDNSGKVTLVGDSAGGNLAAAASHRLRDLHSNGKLLNVQIQRQILIYPALYYYPYDIMHFESYKQFGEYGLLLDGPVINLMWSRYANNTMDEIINNEEYKYLAVLGPNKHCIRFDQLPETIIIAAEYDILKSEAEEYARQLKNGNVPVHYELVSNATHGFAGSTPGAIRIGDIIAKYI